MDSVSKSKKMEKTKTSSGRKSTPKVVAVPTQRPATRSTNKMPKTEYKESNQAKIPEIIDPKSMEYKKFMILKCVSLINREYIMLN